jgi:hypothetical protein
MGIRTIAAGLRALFRKEKEDAELSDELRAYIETSSAEKMASGMTREAAFREARMELGSTEAVKDEVRDAGWETRLYSIGQDLRYALRMLRKNPGFSATAIISLAVAIGANTALFSMVDAVYLKSLPVKDPERLIAFDWAAGEKRTWMGIDGVSRHPNERRVRHSPSAHTSAFAITTPPWRAFSPSLHWSNSTSMSMGRRRSGSVNW